MSFGVILIQIISALLFSMALNDYIKNSRFTDLFITVFAAICILTMLINYAKGV